MSDNNGRDMISAEDIDNMNKLYKEFGWKIPKGFITPEMIYKCKENVLLRAGEATPIRMDLFNKMMEEQYKQKGCLGATGHKSNACTTESNNMTANEALKFSGELLGERAKDRDTKSERSMENTVKSFNIIYGKDLTTTEGWQFMSLLKKVRGAQGNFRVDDYLDDVSYSALATESAVEEHNASKDSKTE